MAGKKKTTSVRKAPVAKAGRRAAPPSAQARTLSQKAAQHQRKFDEAKYEFMRFMNGRMDYISKLPLVKKPELSPQQELTARQNAAALGRKDTSDPFTRLRWLNRFLNGLEEFYNYSPKGQYA